MPDNPPRRVKVSGDFFHGKIPAGAIYVGRTAPGLPMSVYANPFRVGALYGEPGNDQVPPLPDPDAILLEGTQFVRTFSGRDWAYTGRKVTGRAHSVALFIAWAGCVRDDSGLTYPETARRDLAGLSLACWCPLPADGEPDICHAAALLRLAAGLRPVTPDVPHPGGGYQGHIQRSCNGCGDSLGDVTREEISAAMCGLPLPDVGGECPRCPATRPFRGLRKLREDDDG